MEFYSHPLILLPWIFPQPLAHPFPRPGGWAGSEPWYHPSIGSATCSLLQALPCSQPHPKTSQRDSPTAHPGRVTDAILLPRIWGFINSSCCLHEFSMSQNIRSLNYSRVTCVSPHVATFLDASALLEPTGKLRTGFTLANPLLLLEHEWPWHCSRQRWLACAGDWHQGVLVLRGSLVCGRLSPGLYGDIQHIVHGRGWLEAQRGGGG